MTRRLAAAYDVSSCTCLSACPASWGEKGVQSSCVALATSPMSRPTVSFTDSLIKNKIKKRVHPCAAFAGGVCVHWYQS